MAALDDIRARREALHPTTQADGVHQALGRVVNMADRLRNQAAWEGQVRYRDVEQLGALAVHLLERLDGSEVVSVTSGVPS